MSFFVVSNVSYGVGGGILNRYSRHFVAGTYNVTVIFKPKFGIAELIPERAETENIIEI